MPARIGGTVKIDGALLGAGQAVGLEVRVTRPDGGQFSPPAVDADGLSAGGWYLIDVPILDPTDQTGGARPGEQARIHILMKGNELEITAPADGLFSLGESGSTTRIDIVANTPQAGSCSGPMTFVVPAAAHTAGANGAVWRTDLDFANVGPTDVVSDLVLFRANQANLQPEVQTITVGAGKTERLQDVLNTLFHVSNAALGIRVCNDRIGVNSRFYNTLSPCGGGTFGMFIPVESDAQALTQDKVALFHHLSYSLDPNSGFRTNIGFASSSRVNVGMVVRLFDDKGQQIGVKPYTLLPFEHRQFTRIHKELNSPAVTAGFATVEVLTPEARVHTYAMLIDNISGDPIYIPAHLIARTDVSWMGTTVQPDPQSELPSGDAQGER